jgi:hypothetical protein
LCLLNGAAGADVWAAAVPASAPADRQDAVSSLRDALLDVLAQGSDADGLTLAVQGLENDALDLDSARARSAAAVVLLRSVSNPRLVADLRAFVSSRAGTPAADETLALLRQWERILTDQSLRRALAAGLSGAGDLDSSMEGPANGAPSAMAASSAAPAVTKTVFLGMNTQVSARAPISDLGFDIPSSYKAVHSGLAPPGRSPPSSLAFFPFPAEKPQKPSSRSKNPRTAANLKAALISSCRLFPCPRRLS